PDEKDSGRPSSSSGSKSGTARGPRPMSAREAGWFAMAVVDEGRPVAAFQRSATAANCSATTACAVAFPTGARGTLPYPEPATKAYLAIPTPSGAAGASLFTPGQTGPLGPPSSPKRPRWRTPWHRLQRPNQAVVRLRFPKSRVGQQDPGG